MRGGVFIGISRSRFYTCPMRTALILVLAAACGGHAHTSSPSAAPSAAATACPPAVTDAVARARPNEPVKSCKAEHEDGKDIFEARVGSVELELSADGTLLQTEEVVTAMPDAVAAAFAAKYPGAKAKRIERVTSAGKPARFEIAFAGNEATFDESGAFIEEEAADGPPDSED